MRLVNVVGFTASLLLAVSACAPGAPTPRQAVSLRSVPQDKTQYGDFGLDLSAMDQTVKPGDNFFDYVNGSWLKTAVIPPDRSAVGSFQDLQILSEQRMSL